MFELSEANAADYLGYSCSATLLGGGVSNTVLLVETDSLRFVLKQSLGKLRVEQDWFSDRRRIYREASAMRQIAPMLATGTVPEILFEDRENYLFAMTAAPRDAVPWKDQLLNGDVSAATAERVAQILGTMIAGSWKNAGLAAEFGDQAVFDELRLDPYYKSTAQRHPELASHFHRLIEESGRRRYSLVHGDWSPKNFLVSGADVMAIDFEVIHFGDPSFDAAFLLNHLLLKGFARFAARQALREAALRFWSTLLEFIPRNADWFEPATIAHLGALMLARIDGKSPAEYIREEPLKDEIRKYARHLILDPPTTIEGALRVAA